MSIAVGGDDGKTARFIEGEIGTVRARKKSELRGQLRAGDVGSEPEAEAPGVGAVGGDAEIVLAYLVMWLWFSGIGVWLGGDARRRE
jgi:hypothetical protein